jgi:hypothetical protein
LLRLNSEEVDNLDNIDNEELLTVLKWRDENKDVMDYNRKINDWKMETLSLRQMAGEY